MSEDSPFDRTRRSSSDGPWSVRYVIGANRRMALMIEDETPRGKSFIGVPLTGRQAREIRRVMLAMLEEAGEATEGE
jgi:hypothetical protein